MPDLSKLSDDELLALHSKAKKHPGPTTSVDLSKLSDEELLKLHNISLGKMRPKTEEGTSFFRGAVQGGTLGYSDEIVGAGKGLVEGIKAPWGSKYKNAVEGYRSGRDEERAANDAALADNPKAYLGGNIAGGVATSLIPGLGIAKGAKFAASIGKAAALGGATAGGLTEKSPITETGEFASDVGTGALIGGGLQAGFSVLGKGLSALKPSNLRNTANIKAAKAAGALGSDLKKLGPEKTQAMGEAVHAAGLKAMDSLEDIGSKISSAKESAGEAIGKAIESVDDLVVKAKAGIDDMSMPQAAKANLKHRVDQAFQFNMKRVGERIERELINPNRKNPLLELERTKLQDIADRFKEIGSATMKEGNVIKGTQGRLTNFNSETVPQAFKKEVYSIIRSEIDDVIGKTGTLEAGVERLAGKAVSHQGAAAKNESVLSKFVKAKKDYAGLSDAEKINVARQGSFAGNREISLTDTIAGVGGLASGGVPGAIVLGGLNKFARKYGDSVMAVGARKAATIIEKAPSALGKFYNVLEQAAAKGAPALETTHISLMQDPNYRRILDNFEKTNAIQRRLQGGNP